MWWKLYVAVFYVLIFNGLCDGEPSLKIVTRPTVYNLGEKKAIYCEATDISGSDLNWMTNNNTIVHDRGSKHNRVHVDRIKNGHVAVLVINSAQLIDTGNWTCSSGEYSISTPILVGIKAHIADRHQITEGKEGDTITLKCVTDGSPEPVVQWFKDENPIEEESSKYKISKIKDSYQLEVRNLEFDDAGDYECRVTQEQLSYFTDKKIHLDVKHKPIMINPESNEIMTATLSEVYAILNESKNFTCQVVSNPTPKFKWTKKIGSYEKEISTEDIIYNDPQGLYSVLMLRIYNESDLGQYTCIAKNIHGRAMRVFDVNAGTKPMPPDLVEWVRANSSTMWFNVNCSQCLFDIPDTEQNANNLPVTEFQFQLTRVVEDETFPDWDAESFEISVPILISNETIFDVGPLPNNTKFHARVRSKNSAGYSEWYIIMSKDMATTDFAIKLIASVTMIITSIYINMFY